jgi:topoisomerase-4 subunit A
MNVELPVEARLCVFMSDGDDHAAIIGENRKLLVFPLSQLPEMTRGKGVRLQKYKDGAVLDLKTFKLAEGLSWEDSAGRTFTKTKEELAEWLGERASAGRMAPKGFPRSGKFSG